MKQTNRDKWRRAPVILPLLALIPGCRLAPTETLYIQSPEPFQDVIWSIEFDPIRTITLKNGENIDVLQFGDAELLEIKCRPAPVVEFSTGTRLNPMVRTTAEAEKIAERATVEACAQDALRACRQITQDERSTFGRVTYGVWHGKRHSGPALYIQCITPAEFRAWALSPRTKKVRPDAVPMWEQYLREVAAEEEKKHSTQ